jgi:hypothetical protein
VATILYIVGRMLQILGMIYLGYGLFMGISLEKGGMAAEYKWLGIGILAFLIGRLMERQWGSK